MSFRRHLVVETDFQKLEVWKTRACCEFRVEGAVHAWWHRDHFLTGLAWDNLAAAALLRRDGPPRSLLMLGLAGGTTLKILRHLLPDCRFTAVDLDARVVELAREHMGLDELGVEVRIADAYQWAKRQRRRWDVVIDDCYLAGDEDVFRPQGRPDEGIDALRPLLAGGGLLLSNLVTGSGHRRMQSRTRAAFKRAFPEVRSVVTPECLNETLVGGDTVCTGAALDAWREHFPTTRDKSLWDRLSVRGLQVAPR